MSSQTTRPFSQGGELSQLTGVNDEACNTEGGGDEYTAQYTDDYNAVQNTQTEEPLSARVDAICEQNRQIRGFVEKNLKQIEKKRIKLTSRKSEIEDQINIYLDRHKHQSQKSVELQMNIEEMAEKYHIELNQRNNLMEKLKNTQMFVDYFVENYSQVSKVIGDLERIKEDLSHQFEKLSVSLKEKAEEKNKLKLLVQSQMKEKIHKAQVTKELLLKGREACSNNIQELFIQNVNNGNKLNHIQEELILLMNRRTELKDSYNELIPQIKALKEAVVQLHQQADELNTAHASNVQDLKLQINNAKNRNSNLEVKYEEHKQSINILSTKKNELINLFNQMNLASEENTKRLEDKKKELKECNVKTEATNNEILTLEEEIQQFENAPDANSYFKSEISRLEESNNTNDQILLERRQSVEKMCQEEIQLEHTCTDLQVEIQELKKELEESFSYQKEIHSKLEEDKIIHQNERETKTIENKSLQESNVNLDSKLKNLCHSFEEAQVINKKVKSEIEKLIELIKVHNKQINEADKKFEVSESEWEATCTAFNDKIDLNNKKLGMLEELIIDAKPYQDELVILSERKETLNQAIQQQKEKYCETVENLTKSFNSKMTDISGETENYISIMKGLIKTDEEAKASLMEEIKKTESLRNNHEMDLNNMFQEINKLKREEQVKRNRVVKLEKKLRAINKEIKITHQDISDAITNGKAPIERDHSMNLLTQASFSNSLNRFQEPPKKKLAMSSNVPNNAYFNQIKTKQWVESSNIQDDEYEYSEV